MQGDRMTDGPENLDPQGHDRSESSRSKAIADERQLRERLDALERQLSAEPSTGWHDAEGDISCLVTSPALLRWSIKSGAAD